MHIYSTILYSENVKLTTVYEIHHWYAHFKLKTN